MKQLCWAALLALLGVLLATVLVTKAAEAQDQPEAPPASALQDKSGFRFLVNAEQVPIERLFFELDMAQRAQRTNMMIAVFVLAGVIGYSVYFVHAMSRDVRESLDTFCTTLLAVLIEKDQTNAGKVGAAAESGRSGTSGKTDWKEAGQGNGLGEHDVNE